MSAVTLRGVEAGASEAAVTARQRQDDESRAWLRDLEAGGADEQLVESGERVVPHRAVGAKVAQPGP